MKSKSDLIASVEKQSHVGVATLLYSVKSEIYYNAIALKEFIEKKGQLKLFPLERLNFPPIDSSPFMLARRKEFPFILDFFIGLQFWI